VHYTIDCCRMARVHPGVHVEILESYYRKYTEEIIVRRLRIEGHVYVSRPFGQSLVDMMPMMPHEGLVDEVEKDGTRLKLYISMELGKRTAQANHTPFFAGR